MTLALDIGIILVFMSLKLLQAEKNEMVNHKLLQKKQ